MWSALHMYHKMSTFSAWKNVSAKQTNISFSNVFNLSFTIHERKFIKQHIITLYFPIVLFCYFFQSTSTVPLKTMYCVIIISSCVRIHNVPKNLLWVIFTAQNYWIPTFSRNICLNVSRQRAWWSLLFAWLRNQFRQSSEHSLSRATQRHRVSTCSRFRPTAYKERPASS